MLLYALLSYYFLFSSISCTHSVSEQLIEPCKPVIEQVELLVKLSSDLLQVCCQELAVVYRSRLTGPSDRCDFDTTIQKNAETLLMTSSAKGNTFNTSILILFFISKRPSDPLIIVS